MWGQTFEHLRKNGVLETFLNMLTGLSAMVADIRPVAGAAVSLEDFFEA